MSKLKKTSQNDTNPVNGEANGASGHKNEPQTLSTSKSKETLDSEKSVSTAGGISNVQTQLTAVAEIIDGVKGSLGTLEKTFDNIGEQMSTMVQHGEEVEVTEIISGLKVKMNEHNRKLDENVKDIKELHQELLEKHLRDIVIEEVSSAIDELVKEEVDALLPHCIPPELLDKLADHKRELLAVECALHNIESRKANRELGTTDMHARIQRIVKMDGTSSNIFPTTLGEMMDLDGNAAKTLMREYALQGISDIRTHNINQLMHFAGVQYQFVTTSTDQSMLAKITHAGGPRVDPVVGKVAGGYP